MYGKLFINMLLVYNSLFFFEIKNIQLYLNVLSIEDYEANTNLYYRDIKCFHMINNNNNIYI